MIPKLLEGDKVYSRVSQRTGYIKELDTEEVVILFYGELLYGKCNYNDDFKCSTMMVNGKHVYEVEVLDNFFVLGPNQDVERVDSRDE